jgi:hypothetical protein
MIAFPNYLNILIGCIVCVMAIVMSIITLEGPKAATDRLERSVVGVQLFTFRGRYVFDLLIALFLFAMHPLGIVLGIATMALIFGIRFLGVKQPDAFNEIFRQNLQIGTDNHQGSINQGTYESPNMQYPTTMANTSHKDLNQDAYTVESEYDTPVVERR